MPKYQQVCVSADLHFWYDVWVPPVAFSIKKIMRVMHPLPPFASEGL